MVAGSVISAGRRAGGVSRRLTLLEQLCEPPQRSAALELQPGTAAKCRPKLVGPRPCRTRYLVIEPGHVVSVGGERVGGAYLHAPDPAGLALEHDPVRPLEVRDHDLAPERAPDRKLEARRRTEAARLETLEPEVLEVMVRELDVVRDVGEVVVDPLARSIDRDAEREGAHARKIF